MRSFYIKDRSCDSSVMIVHDNRDNSCYMITGRWGIRHDALSLYTMQGKLLAEIRQLSLGLFPKFGLYLDRQRVGTIGKTIGFIHELVYIKGLNWVIVGNIFSNRFKVFRNGHLVFSMVPDQSTNGIFNRVTVTQEADEPLALLVAVILNHWSHHRSRQRVKNAWGRLVPNNGTQLDWNIKIKKIDDELWSH